MSCCESQHVLNFARLQGQGLMANTKWVICVGFIFHQSLQKELAKS